MNRLWELTLYVQCHGVWSVKTSWQIHFCSYLSSIVPQVSGADNSIYITDEFITVSMDLKSSICVFLISPIVIRIIHYSVQFCFSISSHYLPVKFKFRTVVNIDRICIKWKRRYAFQWNISRGRITRRPYIRGEQFEPHSEKQEHNFPTVNVKVLAVVNAAESSLYCQTAEQELEGGRGHRLPDLRIQPAIADVPRDISLLPRNSKTTVTIPLTRTRNRRYVHTALTRSTEVYCIWYICIHPHWQINN